MNEDKQGVLETEARITLAAELRAAGPLWAATADAVANDTHFQNDVVHVGIALRAIMAAASTGLRAAAPDHALVGWAMCVQDATWEEWGPGKGEFCFAGMRYVTSLDEFGCPVLTTALRDALAKAQGPQS